ncbi:putative metalloprotease CJM1_0395 family protein [Pseudomonas sp.]|uniref:putative metalloprotease CJM1_0395 family protein n=1 Tax=Pseudomonas sp. TaxID=306 RepID=UPI002BA6E378|nr:putative metalloprotease CJM1_0395 family protein [Pseudomonas sp.]HUE90826.1 putative metalloprotease CJM1_0395 family protein [Pseudomonas sp.]
MQIGGASSYFAPAALLPARPPASAGPPDTSTDSSRAAPTQVSAAQSLIDEQSASAREEADKPSDSSANSDKAKSREGEPSPQQQRLEQLEIAELVSRDQEVRAHEQAHSAVGGRYAGAPTYTFSRGPDGKRYAVGGEVSIDVGAVPNNPEATLRKMEIVLRAALAPAEPSAQDLRVASQAQAQMTQARVDLVEQRRTEAQQARESSAEGAEQDEEATGREESAASSRQERPAPPSLDLYRKLGGLGETTPAIDLLA